MKRWNILLLNAVTLAAGTALASNPHMTITQVRHGGEGCPQGSVAYNVSPDSRAITLLFDSYVVDSYANDGRPTRKGCDVDLGINVPAGWSYALFNVDFRGFADLEDGAMATQKAKYKFTGSPMQHVGDLELRGPYYDDYFRRSTIPLNPARWSKCSDGRDHKLMIKTSIQVKPMRGGRIKPGGIMTVDSIDGELKQEYGIKWKQCSRPGRGNGSDNPGGGRDHHRRGHGRP